MGLDLSRALHARLASQPRAELLTVALAELAGPARELCDVGAGDGALAARVAARIGARVEGVDVVLQPRRAIPVHAYDGRTLPFADASFELVLLSDVLHHAAEPEALLREALRVARRAVVLKDHFAFGAVSARALALYDWVGNRGTGVALPGRYLAPGAWRALFARVGARLDALRWPLAVHPPALAALTRSELQFAARLVEAA